MNKKIVFLLSGLLSLILFTGCGKLGYSLVLCNNPEVGVHEGQIVKVYVKSNISHSYIIMGLENTEGELEDVFVKLIDSDKRR